MRTNKKKFLIVVLSALILSIGLAYFFPTNIGKNQIITSVDIKQESSIIEQKVEGISLTPINVTKIFYNGKLVGVVRSQNALNEAIKQLEKSYENTIYEGSKLRLSDKLYTLDESTFWDYEDKDEEIIKYLEGKDLFVTEAVQIDIYGENKEIVDSIYVSSLEDFTSALKRFALCFIDEDVYNKLAVEQEIEELTTYGSKQRNAYIQNTIKSTGTGAAVEDIFYDEETIFSYLCYGRDKDLKYYTVEEYDTVEGVASKNGLLAKQLLALNPSIRNEHQALVVGEQILVTYFDSPISVVVETQRIGKVVTYAGANEYRVTDELPAGEKKKIQDAKNGYNDVTYTEIYLNGILASYKTEKTVVVQEPQNAVYLIGAGEVTYDTGDLSFQLPCANPEIICGWRGYAGHNGTDFINTYNRYGDVLACESGVIVGRGYASDMGYYYFIRHSSDYELDYMHMKVMGFFPAGTHVTKGQVIGQIGNTGRSSTPHVHIAVWYKGTRVDPCSPGLLPCDDAKR